MMASTSTPSPAKVKNDASPSPHISPVKEEDASTHTLRRLWQRYGQASIHASRCAEKAVTTNKDEQASKDLGDAIVGVLKSNIDLRRTLTYVEGKLTGQATEAAALEGCMRSQPCIGRKRKRNDSDTITVAKSETETKANKSA